MGCGRGVVGMWQRCGGGGGGYFSRVLVFLGGLVCLRLKFDLPTGS